MKKGVLQPLLYPLAAAAAGADVEVEEEEEEEEDDERDGPQASTRIKTATSGCTKLLSRNDTLVYKKKKKDWDFSFLSFWKIIS